MAEPIAFPSTTANFSLPLLFAGQAQKEFVLNHSLQAIDALLQNSVGDSISSPPATVENGATYRVAENASGSWAGHDGDIAMAIGGAWVFVSPLDGMMIYDRAARRHLLYDGGWKSATAPAAPIGGAVIDIEARAMLSALIEALRGIGIIA